MRLKRLKQLSPQEMLIAVSVLSLLSFLMVRLLHSLLYRTMSLGPYLVLHNTTEFFSVLVSLSIFGVGWYTYDQLKDRHVLFLCCAFLAIGLMDFMHALGYPGMPDLITANSANKSTQFWIAVRLFSAVAFLISAYIYSDGAKRWLSKWNLLIAAFAVSVIVFIGVIYYPSYLPATFIKNSGLTPFKIYSEYLIVGLLIATFAAYWKRFLRTGDKLLIYYLAAFIICIFSELAFILYKSAFDTYNLLGHAYKVIAFFLLYKGIFIASVKCPWVELANANKELQEREKEFRTLVGNLPQEIFLKDKNSVYTFCNENYARHLKINPEEIVGKTDYDFYPHQLAEKHRTYDKRVMKLEKTEDLEERYTQNEQERWAHIVKTPLRDEGGKVIGVLGIFWDITQRKQVEEELRKLKEGLEAKVGERTRELEENVQKLRKSQRAMLYMVEDLNETTRKLGNVNIKLRELDRLKSVFLASMSHELRTPLNSIIGFTGIILQGMSGEVSEEQRKQLTMVKNSASHLLSLINDILDISKIEAGKVELTFEEFNLDNVVREVVETLSPAATEKGLEVLTEEVPEGITLTSDKRRVKQVLMNLGSNAVKFTDQGSVKITARVSGDDNLEVRVIDTGMGVKKGDIDKLFQPFQQIDVSLTKTHEGTGLGLHLSKKLAGFLGGDISARSEYGRGSEFTFTIPLRYEG